MVGVHAISQPDSTQDWNISETSGVHSTNGVRDANNPDTDGVPVTESEQNTIIPENGVPVSHQSASASASAAEFLMNGSANFMAPLDNAHTNTTHLEHINNGSIPKQDKSLSKAKQILRIIESYGVNFSERNTVWKGFDLYLPYVKDQVSNSRPIRMILPAFPMKSPNRKDKVLGQLPDFGEELALHHLNGLCANIKDIYEHGAELLVQSDGLVYNGTAAPDRIASLDLHANFDVQIFLMYLTKMCGTTVRHCGTWLSRRVLFI